AEEGARCFEKPLPCAQARDTGAESAYRGHGVTSSNQSFDGVKQTFDDSVSQVYTESAMNFAPTEEQLLIQKTARDFAEREVAPKAKELDKTGRWPTEIVLRLGELGFLGMIVPSEYGGAGLDTVSYVLAMEEVSRGCASCGVIMSVNNSLFCD